MGKYNDLIGYKKAYALAMKIFEITKRFPPEEKYELTGQIRRASRSVCANMAEGYKRRRYKAYFLSKLNDCETENCETDVWLNFSFDCKYITMQEFTEMINDNNEVARLISYMLSNPEKFM